MASPRTKAKVSVRTWATQNGESASRGKMNARAGPDKPYL